MPANWKQPYLSLQAAQFQLNARLRCLGLKCSSGRLQCFLKSCNLGLHPLVQGCRRRPLGLC
jgi:hypothetical protein